MPEIFNDQKNIFYPSLKLVEMIKILRTII